MANKGNQFQKQLEYHKIPEFYNQYVKYELFKEHVRAFKTKQTRFHIRKLKQGTLQFQGETLQLVINHGNSSSSFNHDPGHKSHVMMGGDMSHMSEFVGVNRTDAQNMPLVTAEQDVISFFEDFKEECKRVDEFFTNQFELLKRDFQKMKDQYEYKNTNLRVIEDNDLDKSGVSASSKQKKKKINKTLGQEKDDFEYATSWRRAFSSLYTRFCWLKSYAQINMLAMEMTIKKAAKTFFDAGEQDRNIEALYTFLQQQNFANRKFFFQDLKDIMLYFAKEFSGKNSKQALKELMAGSGDRIRTKDLIPITLFSGVSATLLMFLIFFLIIPARNSEEKFDLIYRILPIYRFFLVQAIAFLACSVCIHFFRKYSVNYVYIFGIDPKNKLNQYQFLKIFTFLFSCWIWTAVLELLAIRGFIDGFNNGETSAFSMVMTIVMFGYLINPFPILYFPFRMELLYSLFMTVIAPFGLVRFKDFFLGDVLTSLVKPIVDISFITCFYTTSAWHDASVTDSCLPSNLTIAIISYLPFHFRFFQCINRYYYTKQAFPHIVNAGKYFTTIMVVLFSYLSKIYPFLYPYLLLVQLLATTYSYIWDITMDWGLCKSWETGTWGLRSRLKYPPSFYYFSIVTNLLLRLSWTLTLLPNWWFAKKFHDVQGMIMVLTIGEAYRRAQWSLFRVENENVNNFEKYRLIQEIPKAPDDGDSF